MKATHGKPISYTPHKRAKAILSGIFLAGVCAGTVLVSGIVKVSREHLITIPPQPGYYHVTYVYDGDTIAIDMDGTDEKVRLIGVDTPETIKPNSPVECYGVQASSFLKQTLTNKTVRLQADPINQNRDRYDRLLRYVYDESNTLINKQIIQDGYGFAYLSFPFSKADEFRQAQSEARTNKRGLWSGSCTIIGPNSDRPKTNEL